VEQQEGTALQSSRVGWRAACWTITLQVPRAKPTGVLNTRSWVKVLPGSCGWPLLCPSCCCDRMGSVCSRFVEAGDAAPEAPAAPLSFPRSGDVLGVCPWVGSGLVAGAGRDGGAGEGMEASRGWWRWLGLLLALGDYLVLRNTVWFESAFPVSILSVFLNLKMKVAKIKTKDSVFL